MFIGSRNIFIFIVIVLYKDYIIFSLVVNTPDYSRQCIIHISVSFLIILQEAFEFILVSKLRKKPVQESVILT